MTENSPSSSDRRASEILSLIGQPEGPTLEYKATIRDPHQLSQLIGAFANTDGGTLIVGVQEPDVIVGCEAARIRRAFLAAIGYLKPAVEPEFLAIKTDNKWVVAISVKPQSELVIASGGAFKRTGDRLHAMTADDIESRLKSKTDDTSIHSIAEAIAGQTELIAALHSELQYANSFKSKMIDYLIGGSIGAAMGAIATLLVG
mgnify:CR=1 FL=1